MPFWGGARAAGGLVIRAKRVELLVMNGRRVAASVQVPIEGDQPEHLTRALEQAVAAAGGTKRLAVAIESPDALVRFFTLPILPKAEWDAAVQFEARKYVPFKTEVLVWDYRAATNPQTKRLEVVFAAMPRATFQVVQEALAAAGIEPTVVEPRSVSLARLTGTARPGASEAFVCLVDVEEHIAHLSIVRHGVSYLTRDINLWPKAVPPISDPGEGEGATAPAGAEPEAGHGQDAQPPPGPEGPGEPADLRAERLLSELGMSMDFFMRENPSTTIANVLLCGDRQLVEPWCRWLSSRVSCPVELGSELVAPHLEGGGLELSFASSVGLLQTAGSARIDFLKRRLAKAPPVERAPAMSGISIAGLAAALRTPRAAICSAAVAGTLAALWVLGNLRVTSMRRQLSQLAASRPDVGWGLNQMSQEALGPIKEAATARLAFLEQLMGHRVSVAAKLDALARSLPESIWLNGLSFEDPIDLGTGGGRPRLIVQGACFLGAPAEELEAIQQFEEQMKHHPVFFKGFGLAQLEQISQRQESVSSHLYTYRTFQLNCNPEKRL